MEWIRPSRGACRVELGASPILWQLTQRRFSRINRNFRFQLIFAQNHTPATLSCQPQIALATVGWQARLVLRMNFILQKEKQEAERKRIEAQGIADFQRIVAQGISAQLLEWKSIEATEKLAASGNTKIVIIGNPKNGLPLVLEPR